jgi:hypothetical protein
MNLKKFRHKEPRNKGYVNKDVIKINMKSLTRSHSHLYMAAIMPGCDSVRFFDAYPRGSL